MDLQSYVVGLHGSKLLLGTVRATLTADIFLRLSNHLQLPCLKLFANGSELIPFTDTRHFFVITAVIIVIIIITVIITIIIIY